MYSTLVMTSSLLSTPLLSLSSSQSVTEHFSSVAQQASTRTRLVLNCESSNLATIFLVSWTKAEAGREASRTSPEKVLCARIWPTSLKQSGGHESRHPEGEEVVITRPRLRVSAAIYNIYGRRIYPFLSCYYHPHHLRNPLDCL
jgi:hypothetical protein